MTPARALVRPLAPVQPPYACRAARPACGLGASLRRFRAGVRELLTGEEARRTILGTLINYLVR
ncbi:hypothetical protein GCM10012287_30620 [Streptomyces daqingensis]|uniref:Uncharacterized protein n=1 Tax=Streptomyces daqingensis TaxID=1472640 RepID=A0ABQ2MFH1_9ACTN|nr:hypothetical protein GCM10012287_30620 [Streptomyces daqingensis]